MITGWGSGKWRDAALSRWFAGAVVALVAGGWLWSGQAVAGRDQQRTEGQATTLAQVLAAASVGPQLDLAALTVGHLSPEAASDLRSADAGLRHSGKLSGLAIWAMDGHAIFADQPPNSPPMQVTRSDVQRAAAGRVWTAPATGPLHESRLSVFLPVAVTDASTGAHPALIQVVLPASAADSAITGQPLRQQLTLGAMVVALLGGLLGMRRGLLRRERHARIDRLTGLLNRRALHEDARRLLTGATPERPAALLLLDLSQFKAVNDTLGHPAGDQLLQKVATALQGLVRPKDLVVRLGGDEFAVLLVDIPDPDAAQLRAEHLLAGLRTTSFTVDGVALSVDASIGVALAPAHGRRLDELLQHADVAMYQAKGGHRGTTLYDPTTDGRTRGRLELMAELRRALDNNEFVLHYQPKISLPDRRVYGVEALVRWAHPSRGLLPPAEFLPALENSGLMQPLSAWVLREAIHQAANWRRAGKPLKVAVNLSTRSLLNPALPGKVLAALAGADLPAHFLELEITETAIMTDPDRAACILTQLRARGVEVSIDDFGAGYTSLAFLRLLPISALKIDRTLVSRALAAPEDQAVIQAVVDLGHSLGLRVIAEGVETEDLLDRLTALGCDRAQGYLISHPLPRAALEAWLTDWDSSGGPTSKPWHPTDDTNNAATLTGSSGQHQTAPTAVECRSPIDVPATASFPRIRAGGRA